MTDQSKRIIYTNTDGSLAVVIPAPECPLSIEQIMAKDVPANAVVKEVVEVTSIPSDRTFRNAWKHDAVKKVDIDVPKAKLITHDRRRIKREGELTPLDKEININIANQVKVSQVESQRQVIRDKYAAVQLEIDACTTADQLKAIIVREGM